MQRKDFKILIVDDDQSFLALLNNVLKDEGYTVESYQHPQKALSILPIFQPHLVITDMKMPDMDGLSFIEAVKDINLDTEIIMITAFATVQTAVSVMKYGAADYITKPLSDLQQLRNAVQKFFNKQQDIIMLEEDALPPEDIIFAGMADVYNDIKDVCKTDATVILYGETGTGKSMIAKVIHKLSAKKGAFVAINCAAIPDELLESELFGYEKGAFSGAVSSKKGKFEIANDGSIFLDEISEMSIRLQAKLLTVLQEKNFHRLGSLETIKTDARIITATNKDLTQAIKDKTFREDLYYRLNVFPITIPALRERKSAVLPITQYLIKKISMRFGKEYRDLDSESIDAILSYKWYGNVRELENIIQRAIITSKGSKISLSQLLKSHNSFAPEPVNAEIETDLKTIEKIAIENALLKTNGVRKKAAEVLGISLRSLQYKIKEYGIK